MTATMILALTILLEQALKGSATQDTVDWLADRLADATGESTEDILDRFEHLREA
jgi:hypothetical protein